MQASNKVVARVQATESRHCQDQRLARLFMHAGDNADGCYLRDLMTRYRELLSS